MKTFFILIWRFLQGVSIAFVFWVVMWWLLGLALGSESEAREVSAWDRKELARALAREAASAESTGARRREIRSLVDETLRGRRLSAYARRELARDVTAQVRRREPDAEQRAEIAAVLSRGIRDSGLRAYDRLELSRSISEKMEPAREPASRRHSMRRDP